MTPGTDPGEAGADVRQVRVPAGRWARWCENFERGHGFTMLATTRGALTGAAADGSGFTARLPFGAEFSGPADAAAFATAVVAPDDWGVLLVRKGGFAIARLAGERLVDSKVGQRHVQGRTKAGGQSQQRFARRRDNQARQAYEAAVGHALRILGEAPLPVVVGGDRPGVEAVLSEPRLAALRVVGPWLPTPDPRRAVLDRAASDAQAIGVRVFNAPTGV